MVVEQTRAQRVTKNTFYLFIRMCLVLLVSFYTSRVILDVLGIEDFGVYNLVGTFVVFFGFLKTALTNATSRYLTYEIGCGDEKTLTKVYSMAINSHIILAAVLWIVMELFGVWFINTRLNIDPSRIYAANYVFQFSLLTFCIGIIQNPFHSLILANEKMNFYAILSIIEVLLKLGVVYLLLLSSFDKLISYGILLFIVSVIIFISYFIYCRVTFSKIAYIKYWDKSWIKKFMSYSGWSLLVNGADVCSLQSINIFFNLFIGITANAALGIANQVNSGMNLFLGNFTQAFRPQIIKSYAAKDFVYFYKMIFSASKMSFLLYLLVAVPIVINIDFILGIWLGEYPENTAGYLKAIVMFYLFDSFQNPFVTAVHATGNIKYHQIIIGTIKLLAIPAMYLSFKFGGDGVTALLIWASFNIVCSVARTIYMKYLISLDLSEYFKQVIVRIFFLLAVVLPLPYIIVQGLGYGWISFICSTLLSAFLIAIVGYLIVMNSQEREILKKMPIVKKVISVLSK
ncbi:MATE family efflux transporter [Phocaeicola sartorii]|uniref:MATE family efflux transporter n=1 Tax=Phocaeicola sartorii TaxID=671267 RepID=UPI0025580E53|nr:MATE family efflux transporter [Phocaeicola sartorii]